MLIHYPWYPSQPSQPSALCSFQIIVNCPSLDQIPDVLHDVSARSLGHDSRLNCIALGAPRGNSDRMTRLLILPPVIAHPRSILKNLARHAFGSLEESPIFFSGGDLDWRLSRRTVHSAPIALCLIFGGVSQSGLGLRDPHPRKPSPRSICLRAARSLKSQRVPRPPFSRGANSFFCCRHRSNPRAGPYGYIDQVDFLRRATSPFTAGEEKLCRATHSRPRRGLPERAKKVSRTHANGFGTAMAADLIDIDYVFVDEHNRHKRLKGKQPFARRMAPHPNRRQ